MKKKCQRCNRKLVHKTSYCSNCGYVVEKQFNEPCMWLSWETY